MKTAELVNETEDRATYRLNTPILYGCTNCRHQFSTSSVSFRKIRHGTFIAEGEGSIHVICECESIEDMLKGFGYTIMSPLILINNLREQINQLREENAKLKQENVLHSAEIRTLKEHSRNSKYMIDRYGQEATNLNLRLDEAINSNKWLKGQVSDLEKFRVEVTKLLGGQPNTPTDLTIDSLKATIGKANNGMMSKEVYMLGRQISAALGYTDPVLSIEGSIRLIQESRKQLAKLFSRPETSTLQEIINHIHHVGTDRQNMVNELANIIGLKYPNPSWDTAINTLKSLITSYRTSAEQYQEKYERMLAKIMKIMEES